MEALLNKSLQKVSNENTKFKRYLYNRIDWNDRLISIKGARGVGKTTLLLQQIKENHGTTPEVLYVSLDDIYFGENKLVSLADRFVKTGGEYLFLDEVHKYPGWSREIKNIYDDFQNLKVVFTSSSALEILKGDADLSRRAIIYEMANLSLREYVELEYNIKLPVISLDEILNNHLNLALEIGKQIKPIKIFNEYIKFGVYPYYTENKNNYFQRIENTVKLVLETDLPAIINIDYYSVYKLKKLLHVISTNVPFKPNISELSRKIGVTRDTLLRYFDYLNRAHIISLLHSDKSGMSIMAKPEKVYLENTNLLYALTDKTINTGTLRETFFFNQLKKDNAIRFSGLGDFIVNKKYIFEVGGKNKTQKQIAGLPDAFIVSDDIETGFKNKIPLWMFGFLY